MKLFIHIGAPRTGTTTLQSLMNANKARLLKSGLDYPLIGYTDEKRGDAQHNLAFSLMETYPEFVPEKARVSPDVVWNKFADYARAAKTNIFVSSEAFSTLQKDAVEFIRKKLDGIDTEILYVARDAQSWHASMARQQIKQYPYRTELPKPFHGPSDSVRLKQTQAWIDGGLPPNVFDYNRDVLPKLLAHVGVEFEALVPVKKRNENLPLAVLELLMALNGIELVPQKRGRLNRLIESWWFDVSAASPDLTEVGDILQSARLVRSLQTTANGRKPRTMRARLSHIKQELVRNVTPDLTQNTTGITASPAANELLRRLQPIGLKPDEYIPIQDVICKWADQQLKKTVP